MKTITEMRHSLAEKAAGDESFRASLMADPKATIAKELEIQIPENVRVQVHEDSATTAHLILTPNPKLSDEDLEIVAGAYTSAYVDKPNRPDPPMEFDFNDPNITWVLPSEVQ